MSKTALSTKLFRRLLLLLALSGLGMGAILITVADRAIDQASDAQLINASHLLYMMMQDELAAGVLIDQGRDNPQHTASLLSSEDRNAFRASYDWCMFAVFWENRPIARSSWGPAIERVPRALGLHTFSDGEVQWRSYGLVGRDPRLRIVVAERTSIRSISLAPALHKLIVPMVLLVGSGVVVLWCTLRTSLYIVERLAQSINARSLADLTPLDAQEWSRDLNPLITALNKLFARLDQAYEREQAFTDDVAHELRTPLATIRTQAQLIGRTLPKGHENDMGVLIGAVDRANALIDGMLTLARLDATKVARRSIDVHAVVADVVAEVMLDLPADAFEFTVSPEHVVRWPCDGALLRIALAALIDNAVHHARDGQSVDIAIVRTAERLDITIGDRGPGIPAQERERLLRRFERGPASSRSGRGSGLGLSIASKALGLAGGTIHLADRPDGQGLLVVLRLPAPGD
ncbi:HAMP domain-containing histidine kinase [Novosphingobium sp. 1949]|uniref:histidine kinase n=1 Tax=Novosphingobium organovorum TaxID=2930092 RepID=A0ABT0BEK4_9SPHN|nr:HAMP domain-containing sensor histidine kinase [Novosphingobium organovorum]MCJ2183273.1 HAMP domain-containing histidine kinase [Novosphingobium organovorum]